MQTKPSGWAELFASSHKTEYKFVIDGVEYTKNNIQGTPIITKPYMDKLCIGRCCSGTLSLQIRPIDSTIIPKAASVVAYCRLRSQDSTAVTEWIEQGHYYISSRRTNGEILSLMCRDAMAKAGASYLDHTAFTEWPVTMSAAVSEIASIMGITVDSRTVIIAGTDYVVSYPNDLLMSEILSMIAAAHGGNFIITEKNELRLLPIPNVQTSAENKCDIGASYQTYETESTVQLITRITLEDDAGNKFSAGNDTGAEISVKCSYATQQIADALCNPDSGSLYGVKYIPYSVKGAYLDPCTELGDLLRLTSRGTVTHRMIASMTIRCNVSFNVDVSCKADVDDEEEFPYISARDLQASRYVRTDQKYHGNRIDRVNGFTSEYMVNGKVAARLIANSTVFSMQRVVDDSWEDCIYFDAATQKYIITGNVTIKGVITAESLATAGSTTINGANITTGILKSKDGKIQLNLDAGTFKVGDKDLSAALTAVENSITLLASSQIFTKAAGEVTYSPASVTLTAQSAGTLSSYTWYRDNTVISGETSQTLSISASDFTANSATYKVVGKDAAGNTYTDSISIAKLSDGAKGDPGANGQDGADGKDGVSYYTWIKYADSPTSGMSDIPEGKKYMGLAYNKTTSTESTNYSDYEWSLIKGEDGKDGVAGTKGADGTTYYTWVKYADDASGTGMTNNPTGKKYIGLAYNKSTSTESDDPTEYTWALFKGADGVDGKDGAKGDKGDPGADGYTVILSNEFIEVPVDVSHKPLATMSYSCKVSVYKGLLALTPTTETLTASQFKVAVSNTVTGITVAQSTAGTLTVSVNSKTAIIDSTEIVLTITVYNGPTLTAKITVRANMNDVVVSQQASIKLNADNILLRVEKSGVISAINQSAEAITIDAKHLNLNGYVTVTSLENGSTTINGSCITTGSIDASKVSVTNLSASNIVSGTLSASRISGGTLDASKITVTNLDASSIDTSTLKVYKLYAGSSTSVAVTSSGTETLYVGGDGTWNYKYLKIFADTVQFMQFSSGSTSMLVMDVGGQTLRPNTNNMWDLGNVNYGFGTLYINNISCKGSSGACGTTSYPFATGFIEKLYLSSNCYLTASGSSLCVNGTAITASSTVSKIYAGTSTTYYAELNSSYAFFPSSTLYDFTLGSSSYPWKKAYITELYLNGTKFTPSTVDTSKIAYSTTIYASMNASKQLVPAAGTGYYLGNSTYPWQYAYITNLYINGTKFDPSASSSSGANFAGKQLTMGGNTSYYVVCNTSRELRPNTTATYYPFYLGTSSYYWHYAYIGSNTVSIGSGTTSKLGFFGTTPIAKQTLSTTSNNMSYSYATASNYLYILNNLVGILKNKYGLIS